MKSKTAIPGKKYGTSDGSSRKGFMKLHIVATTHPKPSAKLEKLVKRTNSWIERAQEMGLKQWDDRYVKLEEGRIFEVSKQSVKEITLEELERLYARAKFCCGGGGRFYCAGSGA